jgi:hypothetical protein
MRLSVADTCCTEYDEESDDGVSETGSLEIFFAKDSASKAMAPNEATRVAQQTSLSHRPSLKQVSFPHQHDRDGALGGDGTDGSSRSSAKDSGNSKEGDLTLIIELWRADLVTSVVELDEEGNVAGGGEDSKEALSELYPAGG